jgi:germination protein M
MRGRISPFFLIVLVLGLAACGGDDGETTTFDTDTTITTPTETTSTETTSEETTRLRVYFLLDGKVQPVAREVPKTLAVAAAALDELLAGLDARERDEVGVTTSIPTGLEIESIIIEDRVARVTVSDQLEDEALAQIVYTLTQFPTVRQVEIDGKRYTRKTFENETPAILVESPLPFEAVSGAVRATGTANTFEANFNYELVDPDGKVVDENFVTATSGTGTRGTFEFTTKPYTGEAGGGALVVFEISAKDGSRTKEVRIPLELSPS